MIYELRQYIPVPGKEVALRARFDEGIFAIFKQLSFKVVNFWFEDAPTGNLWYLLEWKDRRTMEDGHARFRNDPQWKDLEARTEIDGPILRKVNSVVLKKYEVPTH